MNINCLHCGHKYDLGHAYDDYEGLVRCSTCGGLLDIRTQDGSVKAMRFGVMPTAPAVEQPASIPMPQPTEQPSLQATGNNSAQDGSSQAA